MLDTTLANEANISKLGVITGGAGFIGSRLAHRLKSQGWHVEILDDGSTGSLDRVSDGFSVEEVDLGRLDLKGWRSRIPPESVVFHLAAKKLNTPGVSADDLLRINIEATARMATAAKDVAAQKVVFASSLYVYDHYGVEVADEHCITSPRTLYGMTKQAGESCLRAILNETSVGWSAARLYFTYGPGQFPGSGYKSVIVNNFERILRGLYPTVRGDGEQVLDYVYVDDVVEALAILGERHVTGKTYNVASGVGVSINELTQLMLKVSGFQDLPVQFLEEDWTHGTKRVGSRDLVQAEMGWFPKTDLEAGLLETWKNIQTSNPAGQETRNG